MAISYSEAMISELKSVGTLNYEIATVFAEKHNIAVRSVIAKIRALELPYAAKAPGDKKKKAIATKRTKAVVLKEIDDVSGMDLPSFDKMTLVDLETLLTYLKVINEDQS